MDDRFRTFKNVIVYKYTLFNYLFHNNSVFEIDTDNPTLEKD